MKLVSPNAPASPGGPKRKRGRGADPAEMKRSLTDAAFTSIRTLGFRGTTARSIASLADCNQAAIYYHFDGIDSLLLQALQQSSQERLHRYRHTLAQPSENLSALIATLEGLYHEDRASGHLELLAELMGGVTARPELGPGIDASTHEWLSFIEEQITRAVAPLPLGAMMPAADLADLLLSLVVGLELRNKVDGKSDRSDRLFRLAALAASWVDSQP